MTGYYDIVLGLIPVSLIGITGILTLLGLGLTMAVPMASLVSVGLVGHAMFVNAPVDEPREPRNTATDGAYSAD
jgi:hypothetical protein